MAQDVKSQKWLEKLLVKKIKRIRYQSPVLYFGTRPWDAASGIASMPQWLSIMAARTKADNVFTVSSGRGR